MEESYLYQQIAETLRQEILSGKRQPGEKLPTVRKMTESWACTPGTVQRAYKILAQQGLIHSRPGQGTRVVEQPEVVGFNPLRRATLFNRTENFLLESLSAGYSQNEIELAMRMAMDRWRAVSSPAPISSESIIQFSGSNDLAIAWIAAHFSDIVPNYQLALAFGGSLSGLIALAEGRADLAGSHLWDEENQDYNLPFVERVLPGKQVALVTVARRQLGLIVEAGNPLGLRTLDDLTHPGLHFVNRQSGSGTRVWFDGRLREMHLNPEKIRGYNHEKLTHTDVARSIASGFANVGIGLQAAAAAFDLGFIPLTSELFELVIPAESMQKQPVHQLISWLGSEQARHALAKLEGYDTRQAGTTRWMN